MRSPDLRTQKKKSVSRDAEQFRKLSSTTKIQTSVTQCLIKQKKKEEVVLASLLKVEENYSEVFVSQPHVPTKYIFWLQQCKKDCAFCPAEKPETGTGDLSCEMWDLERLYLAPQPLILKMASADLMQMAAWNTQLTIDRIFLLKKGKQKQMFSVLRILNGKICNIEAPFRNRCC